VSSPLPVLRVESSGQAVQDLRKMARLLPLLCFARIADGLRQPRAALSRFNPLFTPSWHTPVIELFREIERCTVPFALSAVILLRS
jgi:hypothetical protein